jgi:hypothetical protein
MAAGFKGTRLVAAAKAGVAPRAVAARTPALGDDDAATLPEARSAWTCAGISATVSVCDSSPSDSPSACSPDEFIGARPIMLGSAKVLVPLPP